MNKKVLFSTLAMLSMFTSLGADALIWSGGGSTTNGTTANVICNGTDCALPWQNGILIEEKVIIQDIGLENTRFTLVHDNGILGISFDDIALEFYSNNNLIFINNGQIYGISYGIKGNDASIYQFENNRSIKSFAYNIYSQPEDPNQKNYSVSTIKDLFILNDFINTSEIFTEVGHANLGISSYALNNLDINGDFINSGSISAIAGSYNINQNDELFATAYGLNNVSVRGDLINNGDITIGSGGQNINTISYGLNNISVRGDLINNGVISAFFAGDYYDTTYTSYALKDVSVGGNFINTDTIEIFGNGSLETFLNTNIYGIYNLSSDGDFINSGTIEVTTNSSVASASYGIYGDGIKIGGDFINRGSIEADTHAIYLNDSEIVGDFINESNFQSNNAEVFYFSNLKIGGNFINTGDILSTAESFFSFNGVEINGNFVNNGSIASASKGLFFKGRVNGDIVNTGTIESLNDYGVSFVGSTEGNVLLGGTISATNDYGAEIGGIVGGNVEISGDISAGNDYGVYISSLVLGDVKVSGNVTSGHDYGLFLSSIGGNFVNSGSIYAEHFNGVYIENNTIEGDFINNGVIVGNDDRSIHFESANLKGDFINNNEINGSVRFQNESIINGSFINNGSLNSRLDGVSFLTNSILNGDFVNNGNIISNIGSGFETGAQINGDFVNNGIISGDIGFAFGGDLLSKVINNNLGAEISGESEPGILFLGDKEGYTIINKGNISSSLGVAIHFRDTHNNSLTYIGSGELNGALYDIDMGDGTDILNLSNVRGEWFSINGAETINASNYIIQSTYVDDATAMQAHTDATTTDFNFNNIGILVDTAGTYTNGSEILVMSGVDTMTAEDISAFSIQFEGFVGTSGDFFLDGTDLKYRLNSIGEIGAKSDQAITSSTAPIAGASVGALASSMALNRSTMTVVYQHAKAKTKENMEFASLASDAIIHTQKDFDPSGAWLQVFGETAEYDGKITNGVAQSIAYESATNGAVIGYDKTIGNGFLVGSAFSYATSEIDGSSDQFSTDITQYQLSIYGSFNYKRYFVDTQIGMGKSSYKQTRQYIGNDVRSDFEGDSLSLGIGTGYVWSATKRMTLTPYAKMNLVQSKQDAYIENDSFLSVAEVEMSSTQASFGTEMNYALFANNGTKWMPKLFVEYGQELGDEEVAINSQFTDTFANGTTGYAPELGEGIIRVGTGLAILGSENGYNLSFDYKFETRERYTSHGLVLNGKLFF